MEKRKENRRGYIEIGMLSDVTPLSKEEIECKIINTSNYGMSVYSDHDLDVNELVKVRQGNSTVVYTVRWKRKADDINSGIYRYGLEVASFDVRIV